MKKNIAFLLLALAGMGVFAKNISIQIVQNNPAAQDSVCASSSLIEQTILDYFFGTGHIVTNSPVYVKIGAAADDGLKTALSESAEGGMDYLVRIEVDYKPAVRSNNPDAILLENIDRVSWKNYAVKTGLQLSDGTERIGTVNRQNNNENGVSSFANLVALKINASLNGR